DLKAHPYKGPTPPERRAALLKEIAAAVVPCEVGDERAERDDAAIYRAEAVRRRLVGIEAGRAEALVTDRGLAEERVAIGLRKKGAQLLFPLQEPRARCEAAPLAIERLDRDRRERSEEHTSELQSR